MTTHIRQSEFAAIHNLSATEVKAVRDEHLSADEWRAEGRAIFWTNAAAERVKALLIGGNPPEEREFATTDESESSVEESAVAQESPSEIQISATTITVRVTKTARNYLFVYADLNGERISVQCAKKSRKGLLGKTINVRAETSDGETRYFHQP